MSSQHTAQASWERAVRVIKPDQFDSHTPQTAGMRRVSAVSKPLADCFSALLRGQRLWMDTR